MQWWHIPWFMLAIIIIILTVHCQRPGLVDLDDLLGGGRAQKWANSKLFNYLISSTLSSSSCMVVEQHGWSIKPVLPHTHKTKKHVCIIWRRGGSHILWIWNVINYCSQLWYSDSTHDMYCFSVVVFFTSKNNIMWPLLSYGTKMNFAAWNLDHMWYKLKYSHMLIT